MKSLLTFRQMPRLLQTLTWLGLALLLIAMALLIVAVVLGAASTDHALKLGSAGMALGMIGGACTWPTNMYRAHRRHSERPSLRLETWQTQIMAALALAALPLCALALISFTSILFMAPVALNAIGAVVLSAASIWVASIGGS